MKDEIILFKLYFLTNLYVIVIASQSSIYLLDKCLISIDYIQNLVPHWGPAGKGGLEWGIRLALLVWTEAGHLLELYRPKKKVCYPGEQIKRQSFMAIVGWNKFLFFPCDNLDYHSFCIFLFSLYNKSGDLLIWEK